MPPKFHVAHQGECCHSWEWEQGLLHHREPNPDPNQVLNKCALRTGTDAEVVRWGAEQRGTKRWERATWIAGLPYSSHKGHGFRLRNPNRKAPPCAQKPQQRTPWAHQSWSGFQESRASKQPERGSDRKTGETGIDPGGPRERPSPGQLRSHAR